MEPEDAVGGGAADDEVDPLVVVFVLARRGVSGELGQTNLRMLGRRVGDDRARPLKCAVSARSKNKRRSLAGQETRGEHFEARRVAFGCSWYDWCVDGRRIRAACKSAGTESD
jgi:hypothetical protein